MHRKPKFIIMGCRIGLIKYCSLEPSGVGRAHNPLDLAVVLINIKYYEELLTYIITFI